MVQLTMVMDFASQRGRHGFRNLLDGDLCASETVGSKADLAIGACRQRETELRGEKDAHIPSPMTLPRV